MIDQYGRRKPNAEFLRGHFLHEGRLTEIQALSILRQATDLLTTEPNVLKVKSPVTGMLPPHLFGLLGVKPFA
jgi:serine/threonine-protein phosphatase 2B catalytic subunit